MARETVLSKFCLVSRLHRDAAGVALRSDALLAL